MTVVLSSVDAIATALSDDRLVPPQLDAIGPTMALRAEMARFSMPAKRLHPIPGCQCAGGCVIRI